MIQIIALREVNGFNVQKLIAHLKDITYITNAQEIKDAILNTNPKQPEFIKVIEHLEEDEYYNLFYTTAECKTSQRKNELRVFKRQNIYPFDFDGIDLNQIDKYIQAFKKVTNQYFDPDKCAYICSGNGLHILAASDKYFLKNEKDFENEKPIYQNLCAEINDEILDQKLPCAANEQILDLSVFKPRALLRLPETINKKTNKPDAKCYTISTQKTLEYNYELDLYAHNEKYNKQTVNIMKSKRSKIDEKKIFTDCDFFKAIRINPSWLREPQFYAALTIIAHMNKPEQKAKTIIANMKKEGSDSSVVNYTERQLHRKIDAAKKTTKPRSCEGISEVWGKCNSCPHYQKINSPIALKEDDFIATKESGFHTLSDKGNLIPAVNDMVLHTMQKLNPKAMPSSSAVSSTFTFQKTHYKSVMKTQLMSFFNQHYKPSVAEKTLTETYHQLRVHENVIVEDNFFKDSTYKHINFSNGVLDLKTKKLHEHSSNYGFKYCLAYPYDPKANCEQWRWFLNDVFENDQERVKLIQEYLGYAVCDNEYQFHKFLILVGSGRNGKSTLMKVIMNIVSQESYSALSFASFNDETSRRLLEGKLFNFSDELKQWDFKNIDLLKNLSSGGLMTVRQRYADSYQIPACMKLIFACNDVPRMEDVGDSIKERALILPFHRSYKGKDADTGLIPRLTEEASGIFNWLIEGYQRLIEQDGFSSSKAAEQALTEMIEDSSDVELWISETTAIITSKEDSFLSTREVYDAFVDWRIEKGYPPYSVTYLSFCQMLKRHMKSKGYDTTRIKDQKRDTTIRGYQGVKLRKEDIN